MTVAELTEQLKKCPQDAEILIYYDGSPRLVPDFAFLAPSYVKWDGTGPLVVLGEKQDIYNLDATHRWGGEPQVLFDVAKPLGDTE